MKKQILIMAAVISIPFIAQSQEVLPSQVPSVIVNQFNSQFPKAIDIEWEREGHLYNVAFEMDGYREHEVWYDAEGKLLKHTEDLSVTELPKAVTHTIKTDFRGYGIEDAKRITDYGTVVYKLELTALLQQDWEVVIAADGKVLYKMAD